MRRSFLCRGQSALKAVYSPPEAFSICRARVVQTCTSSRSHHQARPLSFSHALSSKRKKTESVASLADLETNPTSRYPPLPQAWQAVIGVECHVQIKDKHKLFSSAPLPSIHSEPNTFVTPFDAAHPGTLPVLNRSALKLAVKAALALGCQVKQESRFDRKHYFYSDLPAGYQITQKYAPLATDGKVHLKFNEGNLASLQDEVVVEIEQIQLEQDTAKSTYFDTGTTSKADIKSGALSGLQSLASQQNLSRSFVDLNRAGTGLIEIVSGPQMKSPEQAGAYVRKLQELLRRVGASDGNMQQGSLRCDVNVSVHRQDEPLGTRCEIKNLNSVRFMMNAISYEAHRQVSILQQGGQIEQETRGYDEAKATTYKLRGKENAPDYRYMPDPNLPPIRISQTELDQLKQSLPELPDARRERLQNDYGLSIRDVNVLMKVGSEDEGNGRISSAQTEAAFSSDDAVDYFEKVSAGRDPQVVVNWIIHELLKNLNAHNLSFHHDCLASNHLGELIDLVCSNQVTGTTAKTILDELISSGSHNLLTSSSTPIYDLLSSRNLLALKTRQDILPLCQHAISQLPQEAEKVRKGNLKVAIRILGQVMKDVKGRADAHLVHRVILEELGIDPARS